jgi:hypothetical protein
MQLKQKGQGVNIKNVQYLMEKNMNYQLTLNPTYKMETDTGYILFYI